MEPVDAGMHLEHQMKIELHTFHMFLLHARHGKISAVDVRSNGRDLNVMIRIYVFHQSR